MTAAARWWEFGHAGSHAKCRQKLHVYSGVASRGRTASTQQNHVAKWMLDCTSVPDVLYLQRDFCDGSVYLDDLLLGRSGVCPAAEVCVSERVLTLPLPASKNIVVVGGGVLLSPLSVSLFSCPGNAISPTIVVLGVTGFIANN